MSDQESGFFSVPIEGHEQAMALMEKLTAVAQPSAVYGAPVTVGEQTIITASEVSVGLGFGFGSGGGPITEVEDAPPAPEPGEGTEESEEAPVGFGSGGGGGGGSMARPIAVIVAGPEGVRVEPVIDATKIALAFLTMLGSVFMLGARMRRWRGRR
jgi:uncharacterized spore protein YtfJ